MATPAVDVKILDGAAVLLRHSRTIPELLFIPYGKSHLEIADIVDRVDMIIWDDYIPDSMKTETRQSIFLHPIVANHKPAHC